MKQRLDFLDIIRGFMVLWMLVLHISLNYGLVTYGQGFNASSLFSWMSFFMVPFYLFSGYMYSGNIDFKDYLWKKEKSLLFPYFFYMIFASIIYEIYYFTTHWTIDSNIFVNVLPSGLPFFNTPLWFLLSLFITCLMYDVIERIQTKWCMGGVKHVLFFLIYLIAFKLSHGNGMRILMYKTVLIGIVYYHLGYTFKQYEAKLSKSKQLLLFVVSLVLYGGINILDPQSMWFVDNLQASGNYFCNLIFSISACYVLYFIFRNPVISSFLKGNIGVIGKYSLVIYASHRYMLNYVYEPVIRNIYPDVPYLLFLVFALVFILISAYIHQLCVNLIYRYA